MAGKEQTSVVEAEEKKKIDLKIEIENFGPISGGEITLKPLTVFVGPNNSGKSYAAMLIHSIFASHDVALHPSEELFSGLSDQEELIAVLEQLVDLEEGKELNISTETTLAIALTGLYKGVLCNEIIRSFSCRLDELTRIGESSSTFTLSYGSFSIRLTHHEGKPKPEDFSPLDQLGIQLSDKIGPKTTQIGYRELTLELLDLVVSAYPKLLDGMLTQCYYLPAARSGILQGHKALVANIVRKAPYAGVRDLEIPKLSGVVSDFLSSIIDLPRETGNFYQLVQDFERELIGGEIVAPIPGEHLYPEIRYRFQGTEIPLHRSSSTVSELAPLFIYLKFKVSPGSILIIEEPEAHLHPGNQRILARLLVRLVREGVNIVITTHSEYLLEQLSNFIMLSKVGPEKRAKKYKYSEEDYVKPDEFAAYVFNYDAESGGHRIEEVEVTEEDGISDEEFARIYDSLYEEIIKLRMDLGGEE